MPVYEFHCNKCDHDFEVIRQASQYDPKKIRCPECKSRRVQRRWSTVYVETSKKS